MKNISFLIVFLFMYASPASVYDIEFKKLNNGNFSMSELVNKRIIVVPFNAVNPDVAELQYLDSLQNTDVSLQVIGIPATDFSGEGNNGNLNSISNSLSPKFIMTKQSQVKKETTIYQHPLFKWLTHVDENNHFDEDADVPGKLFIISKTGLLYSVLPKEVPKAILLEILNQNMN